MAREFFSVGEGRKLALATLGRSDPPGTIGMFAAYEFIEFLPKKGWPSQSSNWVAIQKILRKMAEAGLLTEAAGSPSMPVLGNSYANNASITESQAPGLLWLAPVLGPAFLAPAIGSLTVAVAGVDSLGDHHCASGLRIRADRILTCKHVVEGMMVNDVLEDPAQQAPGAISTEPGELAVLEIDAHPTEDLAVISVDASRSTSAVPQGLAFRDPVWGDRIMALGYPPVSQSKAPSLVVQAGEVVNPSIDTYNPNTPRLFLLSAITRPGNSGGPIVADDGRVVGMAIQDNMTKISGPTAEPFYSALPAQRIAAALADMGHSDLIRFEDWKFVNYR